jgi:hypothetical protein
MNGPIDYGIAATLAAPNRDLHVRCHADGTLDFVRSLDGLPAPTVEEMQAAWDAWEGPPPQWTPFDFIDRFPIHAQLALMSSPDPMVQLFRTKAMVSPVIRADDPRTAQGMAYLVAQGIITQGEHDLILSS